MQHAVHWPRFEVKVLFDQGTPVPLRGHLVNHIVDTAFERGWSTLKNGELLVAAESTGYEVFVTTDKNLHYQQNLTGRRMAIVVLGTTSWPRLRRCIEDISRAIEASVPGSYVEVSVDGPQQT